MIIAPAAPGDPRGCVRWFPRVTVGNPAGIIIALAEAQALDAAAAKRATAASKQDAAILAAERAEARQLAALLVAVQARTCPPATTVWLAACAVAPTAGVAGVVVDGGTEGGR